MTSRGDGSAVHTREPLLIYSETRSALQSTPCQAFHVAQITSESGFAGNLLRTQAEAEKSRT